MKRIHFIVNPIAGSGKHSFTLAYLQTFFNTENYSVTIKHSAYKKHAISLTKESIAEKADIIIACGGDGTINEVASCLVNQPIILGIIPIGSGNGLASHLKISQKIADAIQTIKNQNICKVDVGCMNEHYFFSNTGIGFDAQVVKYYELSESRKLLTYVKATFKSLNTKKNNAMLIINDKTELAAPFMVFISNSNELGYNVSLTPKASLKDGLLDILIVSKIGKLKALLFGFLVLFKKQHVLKEVKTYQDKNLIIRNSENTSFQVQIDGESHLINTPTLSISILENALQVICELL
ncbi:YegS/Rv2252/BmrU family lipid kinase [Lacinutrix sp. WUR7]|uniref:diacylglycerol/lipid kinase family protein n=1 Tax=Lacinutrix sp. WUR7 TaxID=2653681 RepID=UPI00193CFCC0|nr:YegS/Rv2252/BmrU family lipid kinase [Lacinutrix sp. WUR7]QRM87833.1 YegS/Rv2252/BmrU family lipid kinase [Lacinutrix sp. WUR7]